MTVSPKENATMRLAGHFPERTEEQWRELAAAVVNKSRPEGGELGVDEAVDTLRTHLEGGLEIEPLYTRDEDAGPLGVPITIG